MIKHLFEKYKTLITYGLISGFVLVVDTMVSYGMEFVVPKIAANTIGVIPGFFIQYVLASKKVFDSANMRTFKIFAITFLLGLVLADGIIWLFRDIIFNQSEALWAFLISKGVSVVVPFFLMYYIRLKLITGGKK